MLRVEPTDKDILNDTSGVDVIVNEKKMFIDVGLYTPVYSFLEESIPHVGRSCLRGMFGTVEERKIAMSQLMKILEHDTKVLSHPPIECETDTVELVNMCMKHVVEMKSFLNKLVSSWSVHLINTFNNFTSLLTNITRDMDELDRVRQKYKHRDQEFVSNEYASRVVELSKKMEDDITSLRFTYPEPISHERLREVGVSVQNLFTDLVKRVPTKSLQNVRKYYEMKIKECETEACERFKEDVETWSKSLL